MRHPALRTSNEALSEQRLASAIPKQGAVGLAAGSLGAFILVLEMRDTCHRANLWDLERSVESQTFKAPYADGIASSD
jgi:hypothetical protein